MRSLYAVVSPVSDLTAHAVSVVLAPWSAAYEPIKSLLNASSDSEKDSLTAAWRDRKLSELSFVGITCALVASVITGAFSWQSVSQAPWSTTALWYGSLVLNMTAIAMTTQQGLTLNRLSCRPDGSARIRSMLGASMAYSRGEAGVTNPRWDQLYVWQTPIMLLNFSILLFVLGLAIFIIDELIRKSWLDQSVKVAVLFGMVGAFAALNYVSCTILLYKRLMSE